MVGLHFAYRQIRAESTALGFGATLFCGQICCEMARPVIYNRGPITISDPRALGGSGGRLLFGNNGCNVCEEHRAIGIRNTRGIDRRSKYCCRRSVVRGAADVCNDVSAWRRVIPDYANYTILQNDLNHT